MNSDQIMKKLNPYTLSYTVYGGFHRDYNAGGDIVGRNDAIEIINELSCKILELKRQLKEWKDSSVI